MSIVDSVARLSASVIGIVHTRLALAAVEIEEELTRFSSYLLWSLVAMFCAGIAVLLGVLLIVAFFWDTHRLQVLLSLLAFFSGIALLLGWRLRQAIQRKPRLLAYTLDELKRDMSGLRGETDERT